MESADDAAAAAWLAINLLGFMHIKEEI